MTKHFIDNQGNYIGGFDGADPPKGAVEIPSPPPDHASQIWDGVAWSAHTPPPDPDAELDMALAEVKAGLANVSTVADVAQVLSDMLDAMRGKAGRAGRIAGRPT